MQGRLLLDVVVRQRAFVFELLASEDEAWQTRRDALLLLNLELDAPDGIGALELKGCGLAREQLEEDLHKSVPRAAGPVDGGLGYATSTCTAAGWEEGPLPPRAIDSDHGPRSTSARHHLAPSRRSVGAGKCHACQPRRSSHPCGHPQQAQQITVATVDSGVSSRAGSCPSRPLVRFCSMF